MVNLDPRANTGPGTQAISGRITDTSLAIFDILNRITGTPGGQAVKTFNVDGEELELGVYNVERDYGSPLWTRPQLVVFQSAPQRLQQISKVLDTSLEEIKNDITKTISDNIEQLFALIGHKDTTLNAAEETLNAAQDKNSILDKGQALNDKIAELLTNDAPLTDLINAFFANFVIDVQKIDENIFKLFDDHDSDFSNGTTDATASKFLVDLGKGESQIVSGTEALLSIAVNGYKESYENQFGLGTWDSSIQNETIMRQVGTFFKDGKLQLAPELINSIIENKNISEEELKTIKNQGEFTQKISFEEFMRLADSFYGTSGNATAQELLKDHLGALTPKYYEDQRTLLDILKGKNQNIGSANFNAIFRSAEDQVEGAGQGVLDLLTVGFNKTSKNATESFVRSNPLAVIEYLENKRGSASEEDQSKINTQIQQLKSTTEKQLVGLIKWLNNAEDKENIDNQDAISSLEDLRGRLRNGDSISELKSQYESIIKIISPGKQFGVIVDSEEEANTNPEAILNTRLDEGLDEILSQTVVFRNAHSALYASELTESSKKNSEFANRKLPESIEGGEQEEDKTVAPPLIGPTPLAGVIAKIGNEVIYKANNLIYNPEVPGEAWLEGQNTLLKAINKELPLTNGVLAAGGKTAGQVFVDNIKTVFKGIIKTFLDSNSSNKIKADDARNAIEVNDFFEGIDNDFTWNNLDEIETSINAVTINEKNQVIDNSRDNKIKKSGFDKTTQYLNNFINSQQSTLEANNRNISIQNSLKMIADGRILNFDLDIARLQAELILANLANNEEEKSRIQTEINNKQNDKRNAIQTRDNANDDINRFENENQDINTKLNKAKNILFGASPASETNPSESSLISKKNKAKRIIDDCLSGATVDPNKERKNQLLDTYKASEIAYSNSLISSLRANSDGVGNTDLADVFKDSLEKASATDPITGKTIPILDLDGNGVNDFQDIRNVITGIDGIASKITDAFGSKEIKDGGIGQQDIKRLLLLMFVMSITEYSDWEYQLQEADTSRYATDA